MTATPLLLLAALAALRSAPSPDDGGAPSLEVDAGAGSVSVDAGSGFADAPVEAIAPRQDPGPLDGKLPDGGTPTYVAPAREIPPPTPGCTLHFDGNKVLAEEVYKAVLDLPTDARADEDTATLVRNRLETFLHRSGYELATVTTQVRGQHGIDIAIDEGRLEKIVFRGNFNLNTLRFQLGLQLPFEIFNRPELDRQVAQLTKSLGLGHVWYKLVPTQEVKHLGPQVDDLGQIGQLQGHDIVHPQLAYELHVFFTEKVWDNGAWLDLRTSNQDGLEVIGSWQGQDAFLTDDRYRLSASGGLGLRREIYNGNYYPTFSRAYAEAIYFLPVPRLRPLVEARSELVSRQRPDLGLESYYNLFVDALVSGQYELARKQTVVFGLGTRFQDLYGAVPWYSGLNSSQLGQLAGVHPSEGNGCPGPIMAADNCVLGSSTTPIRALRPFAELRLNLLFDDGRERWDRRSDLTVEAREFLPTNDPHFGEARAAWQRVIPFGWHDLWLKASGAWIWGDVPFNNEEPVNGHLRNVFSDLYVHKVASEATEFRFSITRDVFKFSLFNDVAVFGAIKDRYLDAAFDTETFAVGDSFGPGFHALIEGVFQVDAYYALGFTTATNLPLAGAPGNQLGNRNTPHFDNGFNLLLQKVF